MTNSDPKYILSKIRGASNILLNSDSRTDYDALCSVTVLDHYLTSLGINHRTIHANKINDTYKNIFSFNNIEDGLDISNLDLSKFDLLIFLDSGGIDHVSMKEDFSVPVEIETLNIDHHLTNTMFGNMNYVKHYGSCCSVIYDFFKTLDIKLDQEDLSYIALGLITDTGFFRFDSITSYDFYLAGELMERGIKIWDIVAKLTSFEYLDQIKFKTVVFNNLHVNNEKKYAYSFIRAHDLEDINMERVFIRHSDLIKYLVGVDVTFVVAELSEATPCYEVSFRSKSPSIDVSVLAKRLGGGGHKTAAGSKIYDVPSLEEALNLAIATVESHTF